MQRDQFGLVGDLGELRVASRLAGQAEIVHWHKNRVGSKQREEEMPAAEALAHHAAKHFGKPIIGRGEYAEDRGHTHNQMEVTHHEVSIMQRYIQHRLRQERSAQSARHEQRDKADGK